MKEICHCHVTEIEKEYKETIKPDLWLTRTKMWGNAKHNGMMRTLTYDQKPI